MTIYSNFDIWILILDSDNINKKSFKDIYNNLESDKIYILFNYTYNKYLFTLKNVYFIKTEISDLQNKDFKFIKNESE